MSAISSITAEEESDYSVADAEEVEFVPPPPPHIELLNLPVGQSGRICIAHVISYLDDESRASALASCLFLNGAVREYTAGKLEKSVEENNGCVEGQGAMKGGPVLAASPRRVSDFPPSDGDEPEMPKEGQGMDEEKAKAKLSARLSELEYVDRVANGQVQDQEDEVTSTLGIANQRSILDEMDDMEEHISKSSYSLASSSSVATPTPSLGGDVDVDGEQHKSPLMASSHSFDEEEKVTLMDEQAEHNDDFESISTKGTKTQLDMFLSNVNSSGAQTPLSFISPEEEKVHYADDSDHLSGEDELSILPTFSQGTTQSPITPSVKMPSPDPASLIGATRLELGSTNHLGEGSSLHIFGRVQGQQQREASNISTMASIGEAESKASSSNSTGELQQVSLEEDEDPTMSSSSIRQPPAMFNPHPKYSPVDEDVNSARNKPKFTRLRNMHVRGETPPFDEPFDEADMPLVSASMSSLSSSHYVQPHSYPDTPTQPSTSLKSNASMASEDDDTMNGTVDTFDHSSLSRTEYDDDELTAPDVLAQFSDAALFGDTPKLLSDFMAEIMDSAKDAVSQLRMNGGVRRNRIDDSGPIKIGDKYYSHNEALQLWKKAKVKLEDRYQQVDDNGDVMMEQATFFEKNSIFAEEDPSKDDSKSARKTKSKSQIREEQGAVSISELIKRCKLKDLQRTRSEGESTAQAGNVGLSKEKERGINKDENENKLSSTLETVDESNEEKEKTTTTNSDIEETPFDADNETAETEDETKSMDGSRYSVEIDSDTTSHASNTESNLSYGSSIDTKSEKVDLAEDIQLKRGAAAPALIDQAEKLSAQQENRSQAVATPTNQVEKFSTQRTESDSTPIKSNNIQQSNVEINSSIKTYGQKDDIESVAGRDSLPSHMGVEVNSLRDMNFINGKSSEHVKPTGGKSICEQSVLGSQYGTEVLFKPKKRVTARKPRTLASHNMGVRSSKQPSVSVNAAKPSSHTSAKGTTATKQSRVDVKAAKQGSAKQQGEIRGQPSMSKPETVAASMKTATTTQRKMQKKQVSLPLKKLKLGIKKTPKS